MKDFQTQSVLKAKIVVFLPVLFNPNIKFNDKARSKLHIRDVPYALNIAKIQRFFGDGHFVSVGEHFGRDDDLLPKTSYRGTCSTKSRNT